MRGNQRRGLALAALAPGAPVEVTQGLVSRDTDIFDPGADLMGIRGLLTDPNRDLRILARDQGRKSFRAIQAKGPRSGTWRPALLSERAATRLTRVARQASVGVGVAQN